MSHSESTLIYYKTSLQFTWKDDKVIILFPTFCKIRANLKFLEVSFY